MRADLSGITVCGRHNFNAITDRQVMRPARDVPMCSKCVTGLA
jgi:hypothetical protein